MISNLLKQKFGIVSDYIVFALMGLVVLQLIKLLFIINISFLVFHFVPHHALDGYKINVPKILLL